MSTIYEHAKSSCKHLILKTVLLWFLPVTPICCCHWWRSWGTCPPMHAVSKIRHLSDCWRIRSHMTYTLDWQNRHRSSQKVEGSMSSSSLWVSAAGACWLSKEVFIFLVATKTGKNGSSEDNQNHCTRNYCRQMDVDIFNVCYLSTTQSCLVGRCVSHTLGR